MGQVHVSHSGVEIKGADQQALGEDVILKAATAFLRQRPALKDALVAKLSEAIDVEETPTGSVDALKKLPGITLFYHTDFPAPRVHCCVGPNEPWSKPPGLMMGMSKASEFPIKTPAGGWFTLRFPSASRLEFICNDGGSRWDKAPSGGNFHVTRPGLWQLKGGALAEHGAAPPEAAAYPAAMPAVAAPAPMAPPAPPAPKAEAPAGSDPLKLTQGGGIVLVYHSPWMRPHVHFRCGTNSPWTMAPGQALSPSGLDGFPVKDMNGGWWALYFPTALSLEFVLNDGGSNWDKTPSGGNYCANRPGAWKLCAGRLEQILTSPGASAPTSTWSSVSTPSSLGGADAKARPAVPPMATKEAAPVSTKAIPKALALSDTKPAGKSLTEMLKSEGITILYRSSWPAPHMHCRSGLDGTWTALPGLPLPKTTGLAEELGMGPGIEVFGLQLPKVQTLECLFNDGGPHFRWDKAAGGDNFIINAQGVWMLSNGRAEKFNPPPEAPGVPDVLAVSRTSVTLTWPPNMGGVKGYRVYRNGTLITTLSGGVTKHTDMNLMAAQHYRYTVAAVSTQGLVGPTSEETMAETEPAGKPGAPSNLRVLSASGKGVHLAWSSPEDNGGAPVTAYQVFRDKKSLGTVLAVMNKADVSFQDSNVEQGGSYTYSVKACHLPPNADMRKKVLAEREASAAPEDHDLLSGIPEELNVGPAAGPLEVEAVDELELGTCGVDLREQLKSRGVTLYYKTVWRQVYAHCCAKAEVGWTKPPGVALTASPTHAFPMTEGWFVMHLPYARNMEFVLTDGGMQWDKAPGATNYKITTPGVLCLRDGHLDRVAQPPASPKAPLAEAVDGSRVSLTWKPLPAGEGEAPIAAYKVYRNGRLVCTGQDNTCSFTDVNLFAFTDYEYAIAAVNSQGVTGPISEAVQCKTELPGPPSEPRNLRAKVEKLEHGLGIRVEWEPPADCGGAPVASYEILRDGMVVHVYDVPTDRLRSEAEACVPVDADAGSQRRWVRSTCSYSTLSWFRDALEWFDDDIGAGITYSYQVRAVQLGPERADELKEGGLQQRCGSRFLDSVLPSVVGEPCEPTTVNATPFLDPPRMGQNKTFIMFQAFDWSSCKAKSWYTVLLGLLPELRTAGVNMMWLPPPSDSVDDHAYLPRKWYVLDNKYGSAEALQTLVSSCHEQEIWPMLDVVVNHRCASLQDSAGRWLKFEEPDWEGWAVCHNSPAVPGGTGAGCTGEPAQYAPSVDHSNPKIREDVNAYIRHMMDDIGFRCLRFDFVKGYSPHFQKDYVKAAGCPYAVAENWNGDANGLQDYVRQCEGVMAVYDFPLYYVLKRCVAANNFEELNCGGKLNGIAGRDPARAVTFTDNHDTYQLAIVGGAFGNNEQVLRGYAFILTHPGVPCVFHHDYVRGDHIKAKILQLCSIRRDAGIHAQSNVNIARSEGGLYAAIIDNKVAVKIGTNDWSPGGGWKFACAGDQFGVWVRE